jgi:hypothetical protein
VAKASVSKEGIAIDKGDLNQNEGKVEGDHDIEQSKHDVAELEHDDLDQDGNDEEYDQHVDDDDDEEEEEERGDGSLMKAKGGKRGIQNSVRRACEQNDVPSCCGCCCFAK